MFRQFYYLKAVLFINQIKKNWVIGTLKDYSFTKENDDAAD